MKNALILAAICATASVASAAEICYTGGFSTETTNWDNSISLPLFDPSLGTLTSVEWTLGGNVAGSARFESLDAGPTTIELTLAATLTMFAPDNSVLQVTIPTFNSSTNAEAFDGTIDFGGTSGGTFNNLTGTASNSNSSSNPALLALFTGVGMTTLDITADGSSSGTGGGNLITQFTTSAGATFEICYIYTPIPAPSALALLGMGGLLVGRRRR